MSVIASAIGPVRAPAKINLALHVVGQRDDGYHLLESLVVFTRFGDRVTVGRAEADQFVVTGPHASAVPTDGSNLVLRARDTLRSALPSDAGFPVSISLEKNLPPASGIGDGTRATTAPMPELARLWGIDDQAPLVEIGLSLGADVPMCLSPQPALVSGIGERIERLSSFPPLFVVLVNPGVEVPTPKVFSRLKARNNAALERPVPRNREALYAWLGETRNDLQAPALELAPAIGEALKALRVTKARFVRMSGSGATCFGLYATSREAEIAAADIGRTQPDWFVAATESLAASGEDHGGN